MATFSAVRWAASYLYRRDSSRTRGQQNDRYSATPEAIRAPALALYIWSPTGKDAHTGTCRGIRAILLLFREDYSSDCFLDSSHTSPSGSGRFVYGSLSQSHRRNVLSS